MTDTTLFPRRLILTGAIVTGVLLALAVHMLAQGSGLELQSLWRPEPGRPMPAAAALAWWLIATAAFVGGYVMAGLMRSAASGGLSATMRNFLITVAVLLLTGAGHAAATPSPLPFSSSVIGGLIALTLGGVMAFCGAHFATRTS